MKKYKVIDLQETGFMEDTHDEPMTLEELRSRFWGLYANEDKEEKMNFKDFTKDYIEDLWEVKIKECVTEEKEESEIMEDLYKMEIMDIAIENEDWKIVAFVMAGVAGSDGVKGIHKVFDLMHAKYGTRDLIRIMTHIQESGIHSAMNMHMGTDINKQDVKQFGDFIGKGLKGKPLGISVSMKVRGKETIIKIKNLPSFMGKDMCKSFEAWIEQWLKQRLSNLDKKVTVDKVSKE